MRSCFQDDCWMKMMMKMKATADGKSDAGLSQNAALNQNAALMSHRLESLRNMKLLHSALSVHVCTFKPSLWIELVLTVSFLPQVSAEG